MTVVNTLRIEGRNREREKEIERKGAHRRWGREGESFLRNKEKVAERERLISPLLQCPSLMGLP